jgi:hypothetical protein
MTGKIYFMELEELAEFLAAFCETRSTAVFEVKQEHSTKRWVLEFTGGY